MSQVSARVLLRAAGVAVLIDAPDGLLPALLHWGGPLPGLTEADAAAIAESSRPVQSPNDVDTPARVSLLPEATTGWTGRPGLQGSRNGVAWSTDFRVTEITFNGTPLRGFLSAGPGVLRFTAEDAEAQLTLDLEVALSDGGVLTARAGVRNDGTDDYTVDSLTLAFPVPAEASELLDLAGRWARERMPQRRPFTVGTHLRENRKGRTGSDSAYVMHAGTPGFGFADGEVYGVHTAFSGNHLHFAERVFTGIRLLGGGELLLPGELRLAPGETYTGPLVYGVHGTGLDAVARRFHGVLRARKRRLSTRRPVTYNVWEAVYMDHSLPKLLRLAELAAGVGVERFVLDDGWFGARRHEHAGLGDWVVSDDAWPDGLSPLIDRVNELGMEFGLWFEPEMVNPDSDVAREHPDWILSARTSWPVESRFQQVLNLSIPEAYAHVRDQMMALLDAYPIAYIKWDHNRDLVDAGDQTRGGRPAVHEQTLAYYRLLDELREAHPELEIESCSSGGARVDLEVLQRTDRVWVSDCIDPLERQVMNRWTAQLIPLEYMGSHIASRHSHTTGRRHDIGFRAATAVFGHLGIEWDLTEATEEELAQLTDWVAFYKEHRDLLLGGDLVRMDGPDPHQFVHGVVAPDRSRAVIGLAVTASLDALPGPRVRFRGLDAERRYSVRPVRLGAPQGGLKEPVWFGAGVELTGAALERVGFTPPIINPEQAMLFLVDAVD